MARSAFSMMRQMPRRRESVVISMTGFVARDMMNAGELGRGTSSLSTIVDVSRIDK